MPLKRLDRLLADLGVATRSELRQIIRSGRVCVDGAAVTQPEKKLDGERCAITLDGEPLVYREKRTFMLDKPAGVLSVTEDMRQKTVFDLLPPEMRRMGLFPVGRLDKDTSGLLLLTNDGELAHRVIAPRSGIPKRYLAEVEGEVDEEDARAFREGLTLGDGTKCLPAVLEPLGRGRCLVTVMEGKYHQVKRMLAARGKPVVALRRLAVGGLELDESLGAGGFRELSEADLCKVLKTEGIGK